MPLDKKMVHQRYTIESVGFYWLIAEWDEERRLAFGYANLNNNLFAEWGYIDIDELRKFGAQLDKEWKPCTYREAKGRISKERIGEQH